MNFSASPIHYMLNPDHHLAEIDARLHAMKDK